MIRHPGAGAGPLWTLVIAQLALAATSDVITRASSAYESLFGERFGNELNAMLLEHATTLDLSSFENPLLYDKLERARNQTSARISVLVSLFNIAQETVTLLTLLAGFMVLSRWFFLILLISTLPSFLYDGYFSALRYSTVVLLGPLQRQMDYLRRLGTNLEPAKEVRLLNLGPLLSARYRSAASQIYSKIRHLTVSRAIFSSLMNCLSLAGYYSAYIFALVKVISGNISLGTFTFVSSSFSRASASIERIGSGFNTLSENSMYVRDLVEFLEMRPSTSEGLGLHYPRQVQRGIQFDHVSFAYPGSDRLVLRDVSFSISREETVALVGENGSGKSTIVKLLARLYEPSCGRILLDGVDIRDYSLESVRRNIGVLFQDFIRYEMLLRENVALGHPEHLEDEELILRSIRASHSDQILAKLPKGLDQMLGRRFEGGIDLSGGEWQRIALARAYMRDASLVILDEPSASLDARAEYEIIELFRDLIRTKMAVIVSHRFAAARMAKRVILLDSGQITGMGSHTELLSRSPRYAELYQLQGRAYR
jgi:ATP-binding cassette subfamily B protein